MELYFSTTELLVTLWVGFVIVALSLVFRSSLSFTRKMLIVPLTFLALYVTITQSIELLGKPYDGVPEGEFEFIAYKVNMDETTKKKSILLWVKTEEDGDRLYVLPFNDQAKKKLQKSSKRQKAGIKQVGKFKKKKPGEKLETTLWQDLKMYDFPMQRLIPKNSN